MIRMETSFLESPHCYLKSITLYVQILHACQFFLSEQTDNRNVDCIQVYESSLAILSQVKAGVYPNLFLDGHCPTAYSSNLPKHTCLEVSSIPSKTIVSWFRCV